MPSFTDIFYVDALSVIMMTLIGFVGLCVASFARRYLAGDRKQRAFYIHLLGLLVSATAMVSADYLPVLFAGWAVSNVFLTRLMRHKADWRAARASADLAAGNFTLGLVCLAAAFFCLYQASDQVAIRAILSEPVYNMSWLTAGTVCLFITSMTQSALWPFHRWLTSSLNAPTPVSALMHAGLINGGGFLLVRFAPLFLLQPVLLDIIFIAGIATALLGTLWKLMQSDVKRMLACSTMGQMGFMIAQCGLGLFPAAVAHLCWHGLFKAYLFLASGTAAQEKRLDLTYPPKMFHFTLAVICGLGGGVTFCLLSGKDFFATDTTAFLAVLAVIAGAQFALPIVRNRSLMRVPLAFAATLMMGVMYGMSVHFVEAALHPLSLDAPQPLNALHGAALALLIGAWLTIVFGRNPDRAKKPPAWFLKFYVRALNASQPQAQTVTAHRNHYRF